MYIYRHASNLSVRQMAESLGRSYESVAERVDLILTMREAGAAYTLGHLRRLFGVCDRKLCLWVRRGLFGAVRCAPGVEVRVPKTAVVHFVRSAPHEYDLRRVHQEWLKALCFRGRV